MRSLVYYVATTIDGQIAATDGSVEAFTMDPDYLMDLHRTYADALPGPAQEALGIKPPLTQWDTVLMGRNTYGVGLDQGVTSPYPHLNQFVFSQSLDPADCEGVTVVKSDPVEFTPFSQGTGGWQDLAVGWRRARGYAHRRNQRVDSQGESGYHRHGHPALSWDLEAGGLAAPGLAVLRFGSGCSGVPEAVLIDKRRHLDALRRPGRKSMIEVWRKASSHRASVCRSAGLVATTRSVSAS